MVKIGAIPTSEGADLLQFTERSLGKAEIFKADRQPEGLQEGKELSVSLGGKTIRAQELLQTQLHQDSETHFLAVKGAVAGLQLSQSVVDGMGRNGAASSPTKTTHHSSGEGAGFRHPHPGLA